jgi:hypothetical protein
MPENPYFSLEIVSQLPGRIRCRFPRRFETSIDPDALKKRILSLTGIKYLGKINLILISKLSQHSLYILNQA